MEEKERDLAHKEEREEGERRKNPSAFFSGGSVLEIDGTGSAQGLLVSSFRGHPYSCLPAIKPCQVNQIP